MQMQMSRRRQENIDRGQSPCGQHVQALGASANAADALQLPSMSTSFPSPPTITRDPSGSGHPRRRLA